MVCRVRKLMIKNLMQYLIKKGVLILLLFCCGVFSFTSSAQAYDVNKVRMGAGVGNIRIVFDASKKIEYKVFLLDKPKRLVVDIIGASVNPQIEKSAYNGEVVHNMRVGSPDGAVTRIVFDLKKPAIVKKAFVLPPQSGFDWRFAVDISVVSERQYAYAMSVGDVFSSKGSVQVSPPPSRTQISAPPRSSSGNKPISTSTSSSKRKVIVLDPGHGGKDPGAIGHSGVYEKNITLAMAKELKIILEKDKRYKVYLTRSSDTFISLRERVRIARNYDADLFISIHADSAQNKKATGLSVYTLSETASDKEAAALADRENKADIISGLNLVEHSKEVSELLINLAQRETMNRSSEFATFMVNEMRRSVQLVANTHRFAGFAVLKAPDVPSVLLELGYLSNRTEEKLLQQKSYRNKLAVSAKKAIDSFFAGKD